MTASKNYRFPTEFSPVSILTVQTGSRAHGTESPTSDIDLRTVYVQPTRVIIGIGAEQPFQRLEGIDHSAWEVHKFLKMALDNNPTILEVMLSSAKQSCTPEGADLQQLFPQVLSRSRVFNSFRGLANDERKNLLNPDNSELWAKAGAHYLRILFNAIELMQTGRFTVRIVETEIGATVLRAKRKEMTRAEIIAIADVFEQKLVDTYSGSVVPEENNIEPINEYLSEVRRRYW